MNRVANELNTNNLSIPFETEIIFDEDSIGYLYLLLDIINILLLPSLQA